MFHCFNISKHISNSVLFLITFVSCFVYFFAGFLKIIAPGVGFFTISLPQGSGFRTFFVARGWGIRPFKKNSQGDGQAWNELIHYSLKNVYKNATYLH